MRIKGLPGEEAENGKRKRELKKAQKAVEQEKTSFLFQLNNNKT
jgi:hypothetical protein